MLARELQARGVAQAVVILNPLAPETSAALTLAASNPYTDLYTYFIKDPHSQSAALMTAAAAMSAPMHAALRYDEAPAVRHFPRLGILLGDVHSDGALALAGNPHVSYVGSTVALSLIRPERMAAAKLEQRTTWGIQKLDIGALWKAGLQGTAIRIGHLDTGVDGRHPALRTAVADFLLTDPNGFPVPDAATEDTGTHGTHTAGTIAGRPVRRRHIGVAPKAELYSAAVIEGGHVIQRIITAMEWAVERGVKVISMSLGIRGYQDDFLHVINRLRQLDVLPIVAVGNEGPGTSRSPGNYEEVLSVGACDEQLRVPDFSSSDSFPARIGDKSAPDLVAPGVAVISAVPGGGYQESSGTSMATPHIAGLAALLWEAKPQASAAEIEAAILNSCALAPTMSSGRANRGLPNAARAYEQLTGHALQVSGRRVMIVRSPPRRKKLTRSVARKRSSQKLPPHKSGGGKRR
jgi:subtilisin family serine protease